MQRKKCFLAAPFKSLVDNITSKMKDEDIITITNLIQYLERKGYDVHNAHKRESWGKNFMSPEECTKIDFDEIKSCDLFIAFLGKSASPGTHIEIGWASAFGKPIVLLLFNSEKDYAYLVRGLYTIGNVKKIIYNSEQDYVNALDEYFKEIENEV
ncbi:hypothetical protein SH1V18_16370 [Vallitalea longa]|uniref:Nucleoside 2-deoxyribosyltransferase n=1 Tax=Vallitalea longa TaxID=2936439 RepID=A0A9W5Y945_9FIRM|nr:nucleoside 2-deoxyribosyltransferase [Vallitalea longa]GKX29157.1 hypothetical protein SH1V18_16370 [Vallitalea longa]